MRKYLFLAPVAGVALASLGCTPAEHKQFSEDIAIAIHADLIMPTLGPYFVTLIVGAAAPLGGPSVLNALCVDRSLFEEPRDPRVEVVPSIFKLDFANRSLRFNIEEGTTTYNGAVLNRQKIQVTGD